MCNSEEKKGIFIEDINIVNYFELKNQTQMTHFLNSYTTWN